MGKPDATCTWGMGYLTKITFHYGVGGPTFISSSLFSFNWQIVVSETKVAFDISSCLHFLTTLNTVLLLEEVFFTCHLTHKSSECFKYPLGGTITITLTPATKKNFLLKSSHSKTYILGKLIFLASKNLGMENFKPQNILWSFLPL